MWRCYFTTGSDASEKDRGVTRNLRRKKGRYTAIGGLVSPRGINYTDNSAQKIGAHLMLSIKREIMDEKMIRAAEKEGANLFSMDLICSLEYKNL